VEGIFGYRDPTLVEGTRRLARKARELASPARRVAWLTLPSLRDAALLLLAREGARLGVEVMIFQALYHRVVTARHPPEGMIGPGERVALVAEALHQRGWLTSPGEARLFARAIAELKRFGVAPDEVPTGDREAERLAVVFRDYEARRGRRFDPDDVAWEAVRRVEDGEAVPFLGAVFAAGFLELAPRELRFLRAVAERLPVGLVLPEDPGLGLEPLLPPPVAREGLVAENPVHELRWVLAEVKADLLERGYAPDEVAVVAPEGKLLELELLAREYGLPLANEAYRALADTEDGRRLVELLSLAERPSGERLFLLGLEGLAREALKLGLVGFEALSRLAEARGEREAFERAMARLEPGPDPLAWAKGLLAADPVLRESPLRPVFEERAREAWIASGGRDFVRWWRGFLERVRSRRREPAGVALLTPEAAVGRRYKKAYLVYATSGAWALEERESYFVPEESRRPWRALAEGGLPRRIRGRELLLFRALSGLAERLVVTYPATEGGQPLFPEPVLICGEPRPMPPPRAASAYGYAPAPGREDETYPPLPEPGTLAELERWDAWGRCGFKAYIEKKRLLPPEEVAWSEERWFFYWRMLQRAKRDGTPPPEEALAAFGMDKETWRRLELGPRVRLDTWKLPPAVVGGLELGRPVRVFRFGDAPVADVKEAREKFARRSAEVLAAAALAQAGRPAEVWYWGLGGRPVRVWSLDLANEKIQLLINNRLKRARKLLSAWREARAEPRPNWSCRRCAFGDLCREG